MNLFEFDFNRDFSCFLGHFRDVYSQTSQIPKNYPFLSYRAFYTVYSISVYLRAFLLLHDISKVNNLKRFNYRYLVFNRVLFLDHNKIVLN